MQSIGKDGEKAAAKFLEEHGYRVLKYNYRSKRAEIDLICTKEDLLIFVEVKTRSSTTYGEPETFVSENQIRSIVGAAEQFIIEYAWSGELRFDILALVRDKEEYLISHFKDAFY